MNEHFLGDTAVLTGQSMRHITRGPDTINTIAAHLRACGPCGEGFDGLLAALRNEKR